MLIRWCAKKYNLPPNHPLIANRNTADLAVEWYEDLLDRREDLLSAMSAGQGDHMDNIRALDAINEALGEKSVEDGPVITGDPLADQWERELAAGRMPDLSKDSPRPARVRPPLPPQRAGKRGPKRGKR